MSFAYSWRISIRWGLVTTAWIAAMAAVNAIVGERLQPFALNVGLLFLGVLVTKLIESLMDDTRDWKLARSAIEVERIIVSSQVSDAICLGRLRIEKTSLIAASGYRRRYTQNIVFEFDQELALPREDPPEWTLLKKYRLPVIQEKARLENRTFECQPKIDVVGVIVERAQQDRSRVPTKYRMTPAETDYFRFACMPNALDMELGEAVAAELGCEASETLRSRWKLFHPRGFSDLGRLPASAAVGTVTVVVSKVDNVIIFHERSRSVFQVGAESRQERVPLHFVGEGMLPSDKLATGELSPLVTARRGMVEELALEEASDEDIDLIETGVLLDTQRWQPVFCFLALVSRKFERIRSEAPKGKDSKFENADFIPLNFSITNARLRDVLLKQDPKFRIASNHAQAALFLALCWKESISDLERFLVVA